MKKRVLGLDVGVGSIGWAVVDIEEKEERKVVNADINNSAKINDEKIVGAGVRIFQQPIDRNKKSLALIRGEARRARATIERKAERLKYLIKLAKKYALINDTFKLSDFDAPKNTSPKEWDVWGLRDRAVTEKLSNLEIFRVLYHIANHRGFYFPTKAERMDEVAQKEDKITDEEAKKKADENKKIKNSLRKNHKAFLEGKYQTIGQYISQLSQKHNKSDDYSLSIQREDLREEARKIFEFQRSKGNSALCTEFEEQYINNVLMYMTPINEKKLQKMMGICELTGEICFPKEGYASELFTFYNRLNNLAIENKSFKTSEKNKDKKISEIKEKILQLALQKEKVSFSDLREILNLTDFDDKFNLCSYREFNPEYEKIITIKRDKIENIKIDDFSMYNIQGETDVYNCWQDVKPKVKQYFDKNKDAKDKKYYFSDIRKMIPNHQDEGLRFEKLKKDYCLSKEEIGEKDYYAQFEKDTFVSFPGYHKLKKKLKDDFNKLSVENLNDIAEALVYCKSDETRREYLIKKGIQDESLISQILDLNMNDLSKFSRVALTKLNEQLEKGLLFNDAKKEAGFEKKETKKTLQIDKYSGFFENNPTVARIISQLRKVINAITRNEKYKGIDEIHIELATDVANSKDKKARIENGQFRYKQQKDLARERCKELGLNPDDGDTLLRFRLAEEQDWQCLYSGIHISPVESGKAPCGQISIFDCQIDHIIPISRSFNDSLNNKTLCADKENQQKRNMLPFEYFKSVKTEEEWEIFKARVKNLNKLSYTKKNNLLREQFTQEDMDKFISRDLNNTRYACRHIAEYLREHFDFSTAPNQNISDSKRIMVLGGGITAKLRHMWGLDKNRDESNKHHAQDAIVIACADDGHIYYICSILKDLEEKGQRPKHHLIMPWKTFREDVQKTLDNIFVSHQSRHKATGEIHEATIRTLNPNHKNYNPKNLKSGMKIRGGLANYGEMLRTDVFVKKTKTGKNNFYLVPVYLSDMGKELPNKAIVVHKPESEWIAIDDTFKFKFSLYMDDLVKVTKGKKTILGYFKGTHRVNASITLKAHDESFEVSGIGVKQLDNIQKYMVDPLGVTIEVKQERRQLLTGIKSNHQRYLEKKQKKLQKEI